MTGMQEQIDAGVLRELRAVLGDEFGVLVSTFLADSQVRLAAMRTALASSDAEALREAAHSLKGSSLNLGAGTLAGLCRSIEDRARAADFAGASVLVEAVATEYRGVAAALAAAGP